MMNLYRRLYQYWMTWPQKLRFLLVGGYNTVFSYVLFAGLLWLMNEQHEQLALVLSFTLSSVNSFLTQKIYVFATVGGWKSEFLKCLTTWGISYLINATVLWVLVDYLRVNPYIAQAYAVIFLTVFSWIMLKHFAFKKNG
ncbi:MAG: GtrA family protein [Alphaproteobacteria bacterium]|nr:GtrA family protein [Alphaproteobacteria bacterium]